MPSPNQNLRPIQNQKTEALLSGQIPRAGSSDRQFGGILVSMPREQQDPLKSSMANLERGFEAVGGKLTLTAHELRFVSHILNLQRGLTTLDLAQIAEIRPGWSKFFGILPIANNLLIVTLTDGTSYRFVVRGRDGWIEAVTAAVENLHPLDQG